MIITKCYVCNDNDKMNKIKLQYSLAKNVYNTFFYFPYCNIVIK